MVYLYALLPRLARLFRAALVGLLCLSMTITPQMVWAANVLLVTSLKTFETDLGNATLKVEGIDSNMRLGVTPRGELTVSRFHTRQVTLQFKPALAPSPAEATPGKPPLPQRIHIPLPFHLLSGQIDRLTIIQGKDSYLIENIQFDLDADNQALQFRIAQAQSPWGNIRTHFQMQNTMPFPLNGWLDIQQPQGTLPYHLRTELTGDLTRLEITAQHHYQPEARPFALVPVADALTDRQQEDIVQIQASIGLDETRRSHLRFHLQQLQTRHIHPQLSGHMDLNVVAEGSLADQGQLLVTIDAGNSLLQGKPLLVTGSASLQGLKLTQMDLQAQLDKNAFNIQARQAQGQASQTGVDAAATTFSWQADLQNLAQLMPGFAGQFKGKGTLQQSSQGYIADYLLSGRQLQLPKGLMLNGLEARGTASSQMQASISNHIQLRGLSQQDPQGNDSPPIDATLDLTGTLASHQLLLKVQDTDPLLHRNMVAALQGSWQENQWLAQLTQLQDAEGKVFKLAKPAAMRWQAAQGFQLQAMVLDALQGQWRLDHVHYRPAVAADPTRQQAASPVLLETKGAMQDFPVQALLAWLIPGHTPPLPDNHLRISGQWQVKLDKELNGALQLQHARGDWQVYDMTQARWQALGFSALSAAFNARHNQVTLKTSIRSDNAIDLQFQASTEVSPTQQGIVLHHAAPISAQLKANIRQLAWLSRLTSDMQPGGQLMIDAAASGHIGNPTLQGRIDGENLRLEIPSQGLWLEKGRLHATLSDHQIAVSQLHFAGKTGQLDAQGKLLRKQNRWQLEASTTLDHLLALSRVDRWVELSGETRLTMNAVQTAVSGRLQIHKGLFELPKADKPQLDQDVVIESAQVSTPQPESSVLLQDLAVDFGGKPALPFKESEQFMLRGQGLNGALSGNMRLKGMLDDLSASGTLEITGTYLAYGQSLNIETGRLIFSGKIPNIGLDLLATRQVDTTKVGIQINGSLQTPQLKLVSTPETSNENKVSLLVLGQPMSQVGSNDMAMLSVAAGALLSQGDSVSLQTRLAQAVGLDSIDVRGSTPNTYAVSVGKRINSKLVVGYEKSIVGLLNVGKLTYQLTNRISVETRTGSDNALDVFYGFSFD